MDKIAQFLKKYGFTVMLTGVTIALLSVLVIMKFQYGHPVEKKVALAIGITGFVIYIAGRVGVFLERQDSKKKKIEISEETKIPPTDLKK